MPAHRHAKLIMEYAKIAMVDDKPWKHFQYRSDQQLGWIDISGPFTFTSLHYRLKPKTFNINGYDIPLPISEEPLHGECVYIADIGEPQCFFKARYNGGISWYRSALYNGIVHETKEAAIQHSHALISLTSKGCGVLS